MKRLLPFAFFVPAAALAQTPPDAGTLLEGIRPAPTLPARDTGALPEEAARPAMPHDAGVRVSVTAFRITGAKALAETELRPLVADAVGKELSLAELQDVAERITRHYRQRGYLVAQAYLPAQDIKDGVVEIAVLEGRLGKLHIENRSPLDDARVTAPLGGLAEGRAIERKPLERGLLLLSDTPGVEVKSTLKPGATVGTSDLLVDVAPGRRLTGSVDFDTYGNRYTGQYRLGGTLNINNPLGRGDQLTLRAIASEENLAYGRIGYQLPVGGQGTKLGAAWSHMTYELGKDFAPLNAHGTAQVGSLYLLHPFVRSRAFNLYGQVQFDHKRLEDRVDVTATLTDKRSDLWTVTLAGDRRDGFGGGGISSFSLAVSHGDLGIETPVAKTIDDVTARSAGSFTKTNLSLLRLQSLTGKTSLYGSFQAQWASKNLDSSEKFTLGGAYGVRAYPLGEANGDEGWLLNLELRHGFAPGWQLTGFIDAGHVDLNKTPWAAGDNTRDLAGYGIGLNWAKGADWVVKSSLAWRANGRPTSDVDRDPRAWVQVVRYF